MKAMARRGNQYLVSVEGKGVEATGQILDMEQQKLFDRQLLQSILKWGYWEPFDGEVDLEEAGDFAQSLEETHSRSKCMNCDKPPVVDVHWADGRGRAWFCLPCFKEWIKGEYEGDDREIVRAFHVIDGKVPEKIGEGNRIKKMGEELSAEEIVKRIERSVGMKEAGYVWNEGPGRGWWGPPKGTHGAGERGEQPAVETSLTTLDSTSTGMMNFTTEGHREDRSFVRKQVSEWGSDPKLGGSFEEKMSRELVGLSAAQDLMRRSAGKVLMEKGEVVGLLALHHSGNDIVISDFATKRAGYGGYMLRSVFQQASIEGLGVRLFPTASAIPFYKHMGMIDQSGHMYIAPAELRRHFD